MSVITSEQLHCAAARMRPSRHNVRREAALLAQSTASASQEDFVLGSILIVQIASDDSRSSPPGRGGATRSTCPDTSSSVSISTIIGPPASLRVNDRIAVRLIFGFASSAGLSHLTRGDLSVYVALELPKKPDPRHRNAAFHIVTSSLRPSISGPGCPFAAANAIQAVMESPTWTCPRADTCRLPDSHRRCIGGSDPQVRVRGRMLPREERRMHTRCKGLAGSSIAALRHPSQPLRMNSCTQVPPRRRLFHADNCRTLARDE